MTITNTIDCRATGNTYFGTIANKAIFNRPMQGRLADLPKFAAQGGNRFWVYEYTGEGFICRAAQSTRDGAMQYMADNRVLVSVAI